MIKVFRFSLICLFFTLLSYIVYVASTIALADLSHYPVKNLLAKNPTSISETGAEKALQKILTSITLRPANAEYREYLGRLYYLRALSNQDSLTKYNQYLQLAYKAHHKASQLRPQWPYSWANMALMKAKLQQYDAAFLYSIRQAIKYGPWEIASNQALVQAVFSGWKQISTPVKQQAIEALERIYQQDKQAARVLLKHYQLTTDVCSKVRIEELKADKVCRD